MMDPRELPVYEALDALNIPYRRFEHDAVLTMADCDRVDEGIDATHCKNLFLCNRQGTEFFLLLIREDKIFKTKDVSSQIGRSRLSFGNAEQLMERLGLTPGAVTAMGLVNDASHEIVVLIDHDVKNAERVLVHPCVNTASILLSVKDLLKFIESRGNPVMYVTLKTPEEMAEEE